MVMLRTFRGSGYITYRARLCTNAPAIIRLLRSRLCPQYGPSVRLYRSLLRCSIKGIMRRRSSICARSRSA